MCQYFITFLWLSNIPLYHLLFIYSSIYTTCWLSIHHLVGIWIISSLGLLWIMLLWTFVYKSWQEHMSPVLLGIYLGGEWLGPMLTPCLTFWGAVNSIPKCLYHFTFPSAMYMHSSFFTSSLTFITIRLFNIAILRVWSGISLGFWFLSPNG